MIEIQKRRRDNNQLGFVYQLAFVRLANCFPAQQPFEIAEDLLAYISMQIEVPMENIETYQHRRQTLSEHRVAILAYLGLKRFGESENDLLEKFIFDEACRLEQTGPLLVQARQFLKEAKILFPSDDTLRRLIVQQRQVTREHIYSRIAIMLSADFKEKLDSLLTSGNQHHSLHIRCLNNRQGKPPQIQYYSLWTNWNSSRRSVF